MCARGIPSCTFSALALLSASEIEIGHVVAFVVLEAPSPRVPTAHPEAHNHPAMRRQVLLSCLLESGSSVACHDGDPLLLPSLSPSSELSVSRPVLLMFTPLCLANSGRHAPHRLRCANVSAGQISISRANRRGHVRGSSEACEPSI